MTRRAPPAPLWRAAATAALSVPFAFAACSLPPFAEPTSTGGQSGTESTSPTGGGQSGTESTTSTLSGGHSGTGSTQSTGGGQSGTGLTGNTGSGGNSTGSTGGGGNGSSGTTGSTGGGGTASGAGGATTTGSGGSVADAGAPDDAGDAGDASACGATEAIFTPEIGFHIAVCSPITYSTNPPTSGSHYPIWAAFKTYTTPVPAGFLVHSLEHGAVVIAYNCPAGCDADLAALQAFLAARPADPLCVAPLTNRFIVAPDPLLDVPFAASTWGASLKSQCLDFAALGAFIDAHYAKATENFCFDGTDVTAPGSGIPADCGSPLQDAGSD